MFITITKKVIKTNIAYKNMGKNQYIARKGKDCVFFFF